MYTQIQLTKNENPTGSIVYIGIENDDFKNKGLSEQEMEFVFSRFEAGESIVTINRYSFQLFFVKPKKGINSTQQLENARKTGSSMQVLAAQLGIEELTFMSYSIQFNIIYAFAEGFILKNYTFFKYLKNGKIPEKLIKRLVIHSNCFSNDLFNELIAVSEAMWEVRDMVNEPVSYLNAVKLSEIISDLGKKAGFEVEVFHKERIESLKMASLMAVNKGSIDPPTFTVMEWKPDNAINSQPLVFAGKGVVYDTGGLSLKPTPDSMDFMKSDMAGAAVVAGLLYAVAKLRLPVYIVGLVPATDNRPGGNAYAPGDIIDTYKGLTVEVKNTDAEGRLILADALAYASIYKPEILIDIATLTGSAAAAIGSYGIVAMGNADRTVFNRLKISGEQVYERIAELPFWEEYGDLLKSDIADLQNLGGKEAGAITAGKFLEYFTDCPYIHLDIAGTAFLKKDDAYRLKGASGSGFRLLFDFVKKRLEI